LFAQSELGRTEVVGVQQWAEVRRLHFVRGLSIREIHRRTGLHRDTIRGALASDEAPRYSRAASGSKLDPFRDEIHRLLRADPKLPGQRVRELIAQLSHEGGKTIVDDYLREVRPLFAPPPRRFSARSIARARSVSSSAGALIFSKQTPDLLAGIAPCLWSLGAVSETLVWNRQAGIHGHGGRLGLGGRPGSRRRTSAAWITALVKNGAVRTRPPAGTLAQLRGSWPPHGPE
jgi:hypothetical protein